MRKLFSFFKIKKSKNIFSTYDDPKKWSSISDVTLRNYSNIQNRLSHRNKFSNYVLIYYSVFLIINTLTAKYINVYLNYNKELSEYFGIILSVIILAYSLVNNNANYPVRINNIIKSMNAIKTIKRNIKINNIEDFKKEYYKITDNTEIRTDIDFYMTVKQLCKEEDTTIKNINSKDKNDFVNFSKDKLNNYIAELGSIRKIKIKIVFLYFLDILILIIPILATVACFFVKNTN